MRQPSAQLGHHHGQAVHGDPGELLEAGEHHVEAELEDRALGLLPGVEVEVVSGALFELARQRREDEVAVDAELGQLLHAESGVVAARERVPVRGSRGRVRWRRSEEEGVLDEPLLGLREVRV